MPSLLVRNVDGELHAQIKARALAHNRSVEEEVRETLRAAIARDASQVATDHLLTIATRLFGRDGGVELDLPPRSLENERPPVAVGGAP